MKIIKPRLSVNILMLNIQGMAGVWFDRKSNNGFLITKYLIWPDKYL